MYRQFSSVLYYSMLLEQCAELGQSCSRTPVKRCSCSSVCQLYYPLVGLCVPCFKHGD
ncbi:uncharacterized protein DEA37_0009196 [Paragonimus westermani]|uniref:UPF0506 domain-containing protein n=1 Tax=Paragonimus westermani TaxID=34504 RepID=A0A5J4NW96_9TREM|nr:uncharacterized protein DEA37_0009196 [Paragonimus westermani]